MRTFAAAVLATVSSAKLLNSMDFEFVNYISKFGKHYESIDEYSLRFSLYRKVDMEIQRINDTERSSVHGHNHLSDWTAEEKSRLLGMKNVTKDPEFDTAKSHFTSENLAIPTSWNWVNATPAVVNPVQDQGQCGSCWAFSATASLESAKAIFGGVLNKLSEQNFVSCSFLQGNLGCNGGMYGRAWNYAETHPIESEASYPYTSGTTTKSGSCMYNSSLGIQAVASWSTVGTDNTSIMNAIYQQPVSVAIEADTAYFQTYTSGVLTNAAACGTTLDHAVVAVGYGTDPTYGAYYIVRNSWSASWGDQGYVNIGQAPAPGICGINQDVMYVTAA
jgi:C1A family cysteine protease